MPPRARPPGHEVDRRVLLLDLEERLDVLATYIADAGRRGLPVAWQNGASAQLAEARFCAGRLAEARPVDWGA